MSSELCGCGCPGGRGWDIAAERRKVETRLSQIKREVVQQRRQRESERCATISARARGESESSVAESGVASKWQNFSEARLFSMQLRGTFWNISD
jgi:hypothetical protein